MADASAASHRSPSPNFPAPNVLGHTITHTPSPQPVSSPQLAGLSAASALSWAESQLSAELLAQSISAAAPRLLLRNFSIAKVKLLFDIHVADAGPNIPFALDTHR